jgi:hypothetical protein
MEVTQIDHGTFTESRSSADESVRVVYDGECVCDIIHGVGVCQTKYELRLYADIESAVADIESEGWTIGPRAQEMLDGVL